MGDGPQATVHVLHTKTAQTPAKRSRKKKKFDLQNAFLASEPLLSAGLAFLDKANLGKPYVMALRLLASAGQTYLANTATQKHLASLKKLRKQIVALPVDAHAERAALQKKLDKILDQL